MTNLVQAVLERAKQAGITAEKRVPLGPGPEANGGEIYLLFPNGRKKRPVLLTEQRAAALLARSFEKWSCLGDYAAFIDRGQGVIEALIRADASVTLMPPARAYLQRLPGREECDPPVDEFAPRRRPAADRPDGFEEAEEVEADPRFADSYWRVAWASAASNLGVEISPASEPLFLIESGLRFDARLRRTRVSLKIRGVTTSRHDDALALLEQLSSPLFFDMSVRYGINPSLAVAREVEASRHRIPQPRSNETMPFPDHTYERDAVLLYSYGRSAKGLPLLEYLAFYQVLEFFFPSYARDEVIRRLRTRMRDPRFSVDNNSDMVRLLSIASNHGRGFLREVEQLRATIRSITDADDVRELLAAVPPDAPIFDKKNKNSVPAINLRSDDSDLLDQVVDRLYAIRCRIVHSKDGGGSAESAPLLPFGEEARSLDIDIALVRHFAERAIVASRKTATW